MNARLYDFQDLRRPDGYPVGNLESLLKKFRKRAPFFFEIRGDCPAKLLVGFGTTSGCAQYSSADGEPPYLMALESSHDDETGTMEFLTNNEPTDVPSRFRLSRETVTEVIRCFLERDERYPGCSWESV